MPSVFLYAPQDFHNVCLLARTLEVFGYRECFVFDPHALIRERYGRMRSRELRVVSAGAFEKIRWTRLEKLERFLAEHAGRLVATVADPNALPLTRHRFAMDDVLAFGSESRGLPEEVVTKSRAAITIPSVGETQSLNLAVAVGVVLFECSRQLKS